MELYIVNGFYGLIAFVTGISVLNICSFIDRENHHSIKRSRMLVWYGRRKVDTFATLPFNFKSGFMTFIGSALSLYGLYLIVSSISWTDF